MAVRDGAKYVDEAIRSILSQTFPDFEFLIIEDGSNDGTKDICKKWEKADKRLRVILTQGKGLTKALNIGLQHARGEFIARMDADDISVADRFEKQLDFLYSHRDCGVVGTAATYINGKGLPLFNRRMPEDHDSICRGHLMNYGGLIIHPSSMIRREAIDQVGGYDEIFPYSQDYDLWCRIARLWTLHNLSEPLLMYRYHSEGITQSKRRAQGECRDRILRRELEAAGLSEAIAREPGLFIKPRNPIWKMRAAIRDGFYKAALLAVVEIIPWLFERMQGKPMGRLGFRRFQTP